MFSAIARYLTRAFIDRQDATRKKQFLSWNKIEKIALILDNGDALNKSEIDKFTAGLSKYVDVYFLELNAKNPSFGDWIIYTKKDKTWLGLPKSHIDSSIKNRNYQLVICAAQKYPLFAANLVSKINAPYNCGLGNLFGETDLIVKRSASQGLMNYLEEVKKYLQMIRPT